MPYTHRIRRNWRVTVHRHNRAGGALTASRFALLQGAPTTWVKRYAAQLTRTARKIGVQPTSHTWSVRNGHARRAAAYDWTVDQIAGLATALFTYKRSRNAVINGAWS